MLRPYICIHICIYGTPPYTRTSHVRTAVGGVLLCCAKCRKAICRHWEKTWPQGGVQKEEYQFPPICKGSFLIVLPCLGPKSCFKSQVLTPSLLKSSCLPILADAKNNQPTVSTSVCSVLLLSLVGIHDTKITASTTPLGISITQIPICAPLYSPGLVRFRRQRAEWLFFRSSGRCSDVAACFCAEKAVQLLEYFYLPQFTECFCTIMFKQKGVTKKS